MCTVAPLLGLCALLLSGSANALGPVADLVIGNKVISPDGFSRTTTLAGGTFPGPVITGKKGDHFNINVVNQLKNPELLRDTMVHWHGIYQQGGTNWADGAAFVTQCPITANETFAYEFDVIKQAGTFWYNSQLSTQSCDGLRGALVINDPADPHRLLYDVDNESTIITLADWYHITYTGGVPPLPQSTLINGRGRYMNGPAVPLSVIHVQKGKRYRFRIIAMSCQTSFNFAIDRHVLTIIEADGQNTVPLTVDSLQIFPGQRYSAVMKANQPVANYWIRADPDSQGFPGFDGGRNLAILRYSGAPAADPRSTKSGSLPLREVDLRALGNPAAPGMPGPKGADVAINLVTGIDLQTLHFTMNGVPFIPPTAPVLLQILSGVQNAQDMLPKGSVYALPSNKIIEISLPGTSASIGGPHPFHLHGHAFSVVRSAGSARYNYMNPVRRDTVSTGTENDNTTIRFVTDNAGPWFLHCQNDFHRELGLAVVFAENIAQTPRVIKPSSAWDQLCPQYDG